MKELDLRIVSKLLIKGANCARLFISCKEGLSEIIVKIVDSLSGTCIISKN
jgi:hypothetical protein